MVTRNRRSFARRAIKCFASQTWQNTELVIVDDGSESYEDVVASFTAEGSVIHYHRIQPANDVKLGELRNLCLQKARGDYIMQWDDDEWYHPSRVAVQMDALQKSDAVACVLKWTLMHIDTSNFVSKPFRADAGSGTPGTIVHRQLETRYPNLARGEDSEFLKALGQQGKVVCLSREHSHLFIRCFHGDNTWSHSHFTKRLRRTPANMLSFAIAKLRGDLFTHPAFRLTELERDSFQSFVAESKLLGLLRS